MPLISKPNYNQIFASQAPEQDKPAVFNNYPEGWGTESRPNNGKPTIKGFNFLQQTSDLKDLWILQNGACLPYDESIEYADGAPVLKDGVIQYKTGSGFKSRDSVMIPTYNNAADGIDPVTGVAAGAYFNVRSESDESYVDEYQNVGGVPTPSGKSYPSSNAKWQANQVFDGNQSQSEINLYGAKTHDMPAGGYPVGGLVRLDSGDIVKSTIPNNTNNPNSNMTGWVSLNANDKLRTEFVSVWDFFTPQEFAAYKAAPTAYDCTRPIQQFFDYITAKNVGTAYCNGEFRIGTGLVLGRGDVETKLVVGDFVVTALNAIDTMFSLSAGQNFAWVGRISCLGTGSVNYNTRSCRIGFKLSGPNQNSARNKFTAISGSNFTEFGVLVDGVGSLSSLGFIRAYNCGSGRNTAGLSVVSGFSVIEKTGFANSISQTTRISVDTLPPDTLHSGFALTVVIDGDAYNVSDVDRVNNILTLSSWTKSTTISGELRYIFGAGLGIMGGDSSVLSVDMLDVSNCGVGYAAAALYGASIDRIVSQLCGVGVSIGAKIGSAHLAGVIGILYCEGNNIDILRITRSVLNFNIINQVSLYLSTVRYACAVRTGDVYTSYNTLEGVNIGYGAGKLEYQRQPNNAQFSTLRLDVTEPNGSHIYYMNSRTISIQEPDISRNSAYGYDSATITFIGAGKNSAPTGTFTFNAPAGYTVNGQSSVSFTGFSSSAVFHAYLQVEQKNFIIGVTGGTSVGTDTYDPPSLATGDRTPIQTLTMTGAVLGDNVNISFSRNLQGVSLVGYVSATNTVSYYFENRTSATVDLLSGTVKAKII